MCSWFDRYLNLFIFNWRNIWKIWNHYNKSKQRWFVVLEWYAMTFFLVSIFVFIILFIHYCHCCQCLILLPDFPDLEEEYLEEERCFYWGYQRHPKLCLLLLSPHHIHNYPRSYTVVYNCFLRQQAKSGEVSPSLFQRFEPASTSENLNDFAIFKVILKSIPLHFSQILVLYKKVLTGLPFAGSLFQLLDT